MGLDDFKTEGNRTYTKKSSTKREIGDVVHLPEGVDLSDLDVPNSVVVHTAEYYTYIPANENISGTAICICTECDRTASSYEALVKADRLRHRGEDWVTDFIDLAMDNKLEEPDTRPESIRDDSEDQEPSSGLESFSS